MGCSSSIPKDSIILKDLIYSNENVLGSKKYSIQQIKDAFFNLSIDNQIDKQNVIIGFKQLGISFTSENFIVTVDPFLKTFQCKSIIEEESCQYNFRDLMAALFILSNSSTEQKAKAVFRLYDYGNNNSMSENELDYLLINIFQIVTDFTEQITTRHVEDQRYQSPLIQLQQQYIQEQKYQNIHQKCIKIEEMAFNDQQKQEITEIDFAKLILDVQNQINYNLMTSKGIRKFLSNSFKNDYKVQMEIQ